MVLLVLLIPFFSPFKLVAMAYYYHTSTYKHFILAKYPIPNNFFIFNEIQIPVFSCLYFVCFENVELEKRNIQYSPTI
jgi:hypothetical protein